MAAVGSSYVWLEPLTVKMTKPGADGVPMSVEDMSWLVAFIEIGCTLGPIPAGYLADWFGRKYVSLSIGPVVLIGWILIIFTKSLAVLYVVRLLHGFACSVAFTINPIYTAEIVDPAIRGALSGLFQVAFYVGCLYSFSIGPYLSYDWYAVAGTAIPLLYTVAFIFFPESPYWLLKRGKLEEAKFTLKWFRCEDDIDKLFDSMRLAVAEETSNKSSWKTLFLDKYERKAFLLLQIVCISKFLTGMPTIITYATETFAKSESFFSATEMTIILGVLLSGIGVLSAYLSDRVGRKFLLLLSCFGCFVAHTFTTTYYFLHEKTEIDAGPYVWLMYLGVFLYCLFSDIGLGPLLQTLQAELFGANTREIAGGITETFAAVLCFVVIKVYQPVSDEFGVYVNFMFYGIVGLVGGILISALMFETKGKTIGRMDGRSDTF